MRKPIGLGVQQLVQRVEAVQIVGRSVEILHVPADKIRNRCRLLRQLAEPSLDHLLLPLPLGDRSGLDLRALGQVFQSRHDALQLAQVLGICRQGLLQRFEPVGEDGMIAPRVQRQVPVEVGQPERPVVKLQFQLARFEHLPILIAEDRKKDLVPQALFQRVPVDVKKRGVRRSGPVLQHVVPPGVFRGSGAHVVGNHIQELPHPRARAVPQPSPGNLAGGPIGGSVGHSRPPRSRGRLPERLFR